MSEDLFVFPMSFAQERLWLLAELEPESTSYNMAAAVRLDGPLDTGRVETCVSEIVQRHEVLRTTFEVVDGQPCQVIRPARAQRIPVVDLRGLPPSEREPEARRLIERESRRPFDLVNGPLLRLLLLRLGPDEHVLVWVVHHIVFDGWSTQLVLREFAALYTAFTASQPSPLADVALQYADFADWQRRRAETGALAAQLAYWTQKLAGQDGILELPTDRPRPAVQGHHGARYFFQLPGELANGLRDRAKQRGTTLYTVLLAAFQAVLARYTGATDIRVGTPVTNRSRAELEGLVGCFANTVVLRTDLGGDPSFASLLARVKDTVRDAQANQEVPFDRVVEAVRPTRDLSHAPLCQVLFALQPALGEAPRIPGLDMRLLDLDAGGAQFDLSLEFAPDGEGLAGAIEYDEDLFDEARIARFGAHVRRVLEGAVANPDARLSQLPMLAPEELRQLLAWSRSGPSSLASPSTSRPVHRMFEEQAARTPEAVAIVHDEQHLTYGELDRRSLRLAYDLRSRGVGGEGAGEVRVGVCLPRSIGMIVAVLGVLRAGGTYVPIDPKYPRERIAGLVGDAGVSVVVADGGAMGDLPPGVEVVDLDPALGGLRGSPSETGGLPDPTFRAEDFAAGQAAYILYTSGSTGVPKGVVVAQRTLARFVETAAAHYAIAPGDRVLQFAALSFDASVEEIFPCLVRGATLVLRTEEMLESVASFLAACARWGMTVLDLPTMYWHRVVAGLEEGLTVPACLRLLIIGGEAALPERVSAWRAARGVAQVRLLNTYGPAEATVSATASDLMAIDARGAIDARDAWAIPIGRPLAGVRAHVLDRAGEPVPIGVMGELYLGGEGLARGYWRRPDQTAARFVPDPFSERPGERLYRTGDCVRWRDDGQLEFAGRVDHQVKLRGFRIEPGEIEAQLAAHPGVREAIVLVREDRPGDRRLVAYVAADATVEPEALRRTLKERVPDYMVPSSFVVRGELPHTPHGKIDRGALPAPTIDIEREATAPATHAEEVLAAVWAALLGRPAVGTRENFFELGGDSILALQVVSRARAAGLAITARQIFLHQTVAELAAVAEALAHPPARAERAEGDVPLTPIQRWFFAQGAENPHHWNQSFLLELRQPVVFEALEAAVAAVAEHHDALRLRFVDTGGAYHQAYAGAPRAAVGRVRVPEAPAEEISREGRITRAAEPWQSQLHLSDGPLLRAVLLEGALSEPAHLLLVAHHLVVDAVSWRILLEDLQLAYAQHTSGEAIRLPATSIPFGAWARRLSAHARSEAIRKHAPAWIAQGGPTPLLPVDDPNGAAVEGETVRLTERLDADATRLLLESAPAYRLRVEEILLTALAGALAQWTGDDTVLIEMEAHGRDALDDADASRTVGWFTSLYPVRLAIPRGAAPDHALREVRERLRSLSPMRESYGLLRHLASDADTQLLRARGAPHVSFNYLGQWDDLFAQSPLFAFSEADPGAERDPKAPRAYELEIDAAVVGGRLRITWSYSGARYRRGTIAELHHDFAARLRALSAHAAAAAARGEVPYTPSDFPLARLQRATLDRVLASRRDVEDVYPLSPLQQGLLFHSLYEPGSGVYVEQVTCRLEGALDQDAFRRAWEAVVEHHGVLRTTFLWEGADEPLQIVRRTAAIAIGAEDWRGLGADEQRARIEARLEADRAEGFDLGQGPLMRVALLRLEDSVHRVLWSHHHLVLDGWSAAIVLRDAFSAYDALRSGRAIALAARTRYRDHIAWLQEHDPDAARPFWQRTLEGFHAATPLPFERAQPGDPPSGQGAETRLLSASATERLQRFAQQQRLTLSAVAQGAWAFVLARTARSEDVLFGITVAGRSAALPASAGLSGVEGMVGLFINTLPLRVAVPASTTVGDWLRDLAKRTTELGPYEHTPLARARAWSPLPSGQPLFESLLVFENYPADPRAYQGLPGLAVRDVAFEEQTNYPLTLTVVPGPELRLRLAYDRRRFDREGAAHVLELVEAALRQLTSHPEVPVGALSLLGELHDRRSLAKRNATERDYAGDRLVHELFEAHAAAKPDDVALIFDERSLRYRELNERANQVAHALRRAGVGPDVLVAIAMERSVEMVVGLLGVLKAGGAYVPIDPEYPADRIAFMLEDAGAEVLLSQWPVASRLPAHRARVLCLDADRATLEREPTANPAVRVAGDNLAYTIYTSGSTGRPKGAGNSHRGLLNRLQWMQERYGLSASDRVLQKTPFSFDVSVWEFFWPLMTGAGLVVARPGDHRDGDRLVELIMRHDVTTLHFVPPMLQAFLETPGVSSCRSLRRVICSGEALPSELARRFFERLGAELHNLYGPTEASIDVTAWACQPEDDGASVPIGTPIANVQTYILDRQGHPVPDGVAGEIHLGGVQLARGYHRRPELTAERFIPDPFGTAPGGRLYRTGDLARYRADGAIEFLGRLDHQVKIRGLRVELGEIEARLLQHPDVREAVVVAREQAHGGKSLAAYVSVAAASAAPPAIGSSAGGASAIGSSAGGASPIGASAGGASAIGASAGGASAIGSSAGGASAIGSSAGVPAAPPGPEDLRAWVAECLPAYMVPARILVLDRLPLSPNGKVDRRALPAPDAMAAAQRPYAPPRTEAERILAEVWAALLGRERIGIDDDFFELGGDSIVTLQVIARAAQRGLRLTPKQMFDHPTIAQAAAVAVPLDASAAPSNAATAPSNAATAPSNAATAPSNAATAPSNAATAPSNAATAPSNAATAPSNAATAPSNAATAPSSASTDDTPAEAARGGSSLVAGDGPPAANNPDLGLSPEEWSDLLDELER
ncbi:amino acid adenylation domain-containing protein [Pendulispora albinea]|uniref:Amino acid adenylation domain-containing protein n=1 Tax=Pendulispora albinea TaxID=2741071 RepID=A0ABZ2M302_9BACT